MFININNNQFLIIEFAKTVDGKNNNSGHNCINNSYREEINRMPFNVHERKLEYLRISIR